MTIRTLAGVGCLMLCALGCAPEQPGSGQSLGQAVQAAGGHPHLMPKDDAVAPDAVTARSDVSYFGGKVISSVRVVALNWNGDVNPAISGGVGAFYAAVTASPYFDWLTEYNTVGLTGRDNLPGSNQTISRGSFASSITLNPTHNQTTVSDSDVQAELTQQISSGALPPADDNVLYAIDFPKGITITSGSSASCTQFCGYHNSFQIGTQDVYYSVLPSTEPGTGCDHGCGSDPNFFNNATMVASHELVESVTDSQVGLPENNQGRPLAWINSAAGEIGDLCRALPGTVIAPDGTAYTVQKEYDNASHGCIVGKDPASDFTATLDLPSSTLSRAGTLTTTIQTAVTQGAGQQATLTVEGLPSGVSGVFTPAQITTGDTATLTFTAFDSAPLGDVSFSVTAQGINVARTATGSFTVGPDTGTDTLLSPGQPLTVSGAKDVVQSFKVEVPNGASALLVRMTPASTNVDAELLVRFAARPTEQLYDCQQFVLGGVNVCTFKPPTAGTYYVSLKGFGDFTGMTLLATEQ